MPQTHKVLGQSNPAATTLTTLYTVPASTSAVVSTLVICNTASSATTLSTALGSCRFRCCQSGRTRNRRKWSSAGYPTTRRGPHYRCRRSY